VSRAANRLALSLMTTAGVVAAAPAAAHAHGLVGRADLPIPEELFVAGAAAVLVVSFAGLAVLWPRPLLERVRERRLLTPPAVADVALGLLGVLLFGAVVYAGLAGTSTPTANLAPTAVYVLFWVGIPVLSVLLGDVFSALSPWRALARAVGWVAGRVARGRLPEPLAYPARLGHWPAVAGIAAFAWLELVRTGNDDPRLLAVLALVYATVQLVGMSLFGVEPWSRRGDAFGVYFGLFARLAPLVRRHGRLALRAPVAGAATLTPVAGTVALLCVALGATVFDGFSQGALWSSLAPDLQDLFRSAGLGPGAALELTFTAGLIGAVLFVSGLYHLGVHGMPRLAGEGAARRFVHALLPIAFAYVVAHYFSLLVYQGQATVFLVSDPLGDGSDLLGTADRQIDYGVIDATGIWYVQVGVLVAGHVAGLVLAHDRALVAYGDARQATRSQYAMLAVMIAFTTLGLWLLSKANG